MKLKTIKLKLILLFFSFLWIQQVQGITLFVNAPTHSTIVPKKYKGVKKKKKEKLVKKLENLQSKINRSKEKEKRKTKGDIFVIIGLSLIGLSLVFGLALLLISRSDESDFFRQLFLGIIAYIAGVACLIVGLALLITGIIIQSLDKKRAQEQEKSGETS